MTEAIEPVGISIKFDERLLIRVDGAVLDGHAVSRSDFIRAAVREKLDKLDRMEGTDRAAHC